MIKKVLFTISVIILSLNLFSINSFADTAKGQKIIIKKLKKDCGFNGAKLAALHTQDEWTDIQTKGNLNVELKKLCPKSKPLKDKYIPHVYDFLNNYASDSGNVPSC